MKRTFPAMALVIVANSLALLMAWRNRSEPRQEITLSEHEFFVERESRQRSSVFLRLTTTITELSWLNEAKMAALGFSPLHSEEDSHQLLRRGFVASRTTRPHDLIPPESNRNGQICKYSSNVSKIDSKNANVVISQ